MKPFGTIVIAILVFGLPALAQPSPGRVFDNFDRSQGVNVYRPPAPPAPPVSNKIAKRVKKNGKWVVEYVDPLVKKTGRSTPRMTVAVTDGLAHAKAALQN
jgi:hypothetical protein